MIEENVCAHYETLQRQKKVWRIAKQEIADYFVGFGWELNIQNMLLVLLLEFSEFFVYFSFIRSWILARAPASHYF